MEKLRRYDIYAPLQDEDASIGYPEAVEMVLETMEGFSHGFAQRARQIIDAGHIDSHPVMNKQPGAFCATIGPSIVPYVLLNFDGTLKDVSTIAHELGHGVHSLYANNLPHDAQNPPLPLAETASTFAEMVMFEKLLEKAPSDAVRKSMLSDKVAHSYATIIRQTYFVKFEVLAHEAISNGVTAEELSDIYFGTLQEQFGDALELNPLFRYEWAVIPHIVHTPFYCYAYNFGELLSLSLFARYKEEGDAFIPKIEQILSYGGSKAPQKVLQEVGVDMASREFWQGSFNIIRGWQNQLERY